MLHKIKQGNEKDFQKPIPISVPIPEDPKNQTLFQQYHLTKIFDIENGKLISADNKLRTRIVEDNSKLVTFVVNNFFSRKVHKPYREDLLQEGYIGLFDAVEKFDPTLGYKFSTYAVYWIHQACSSFLMSKNQLIHIPGHVRVAKNKLNRYIKQNNKNIDDVTAEDLEQLEITPKMFISIKAASKAKQSNIVFLNATLSGSTNTTHEEVFTDVDKQWDSASIDKERLSDAIRKSFSNLTEREQMVLLLRFGISKEEEVQ